MKTLPEMFPNLSQSTLERNPHLSPLKAKKTIPGASGGSGNGNYESDHQCKIQDSESKRDETPALGSAIPGKAESVSRITVRFTGYRCRPLDPDNFAAGCKDLLDGLRHSGILHGDEPWRINFETRQEKVESYDQERTVIEIEL